jgi:hypothetical protein
MWMRCQLALRRKVLVVLFLQRKSNVENVIIFVVTVPPLLALEV